MPGYPTLLQAHSTLISCSAKLQAQQRSGTVSGFGSFAFAKSGFPWTHLSNRMSHRLSQHHHLSSRVRAPTVPAGATSFRWLYSRIYWQTVPAVWQCGSAQCTDLQYRSTHGTFNADNADNVIEWWVERNVKWNGEGVKGGAWQKCRMLKH